MRGILLALSVVMVLALPATVHGQRFDPITVGPTTLSVQYTSACAATTCTSINLGSFTGVGIQVTGTCGTCTLNFESTIDGTTWVAQNMVPSNSATAAASTAAVGQWYGRVVARTFRARMSALSSGSFVVSLRAAPNGG